MASESVPPHLLALGEPLGPISFLPWTYPALQLVARGLMSVDVEGFGSLKLTGASRAVLRGAARHVRSAVAARRLGPEEAEAAPRASGRVARAKRITLSPERQGLFDALRAHRRDLAKVQGVPPCAIFHDVTLEAMAEQQPCTLEEFAALPGVGEKKLERHAAEFIAVIEDHA